MSRPFIAIVSCARDTLNGFNDAIRKTWLKDISSDYAFILGRDATPTQSDEVVVDSKDDYLSLPEKTHALLIWALNKGYDYIFKCDTDTYVKAKEILSSDYAQNDYIGYFNGPIGDPMAIYNRVYAWASGGSGYWLSKRAADYVAANPPDSRAICPVLRYPCEDLWVGQLMGEKIASGEFTGLHDERYWRGYRSNFKVEFTAHYCSEGMHRKFNTSWMYTHHEVNK
jgi:hypothetical protein